MDQRSILFVNQWIGAHGVIDHGIRRSWFWILPDEPDHAYISQGDLTIRLRLLLCIVLLLNHPWTWDVSHFPPVQWFKCTTLRCTADIRWHFQGTSIHNATYNIIQWTQQQSSVHEKSELSFIVMVSLSFYRFVVETTKVSSKSDDTIQIHLPPKTLICTLSTGCFTMQSLWPWKKPSIPSWFESSH